MWHTGVARAHYRPACPFVRIAFVMAITRATTSICFEAVPAEPVTVVTRES